MSSEYECHPESGQVEMPCEWVRSLGFGDSSFVAMNSGLFISPGYGFHPTRVLDSHELIFVVGGSLELFEESQSFPVDKNDMLILAAGRRHGAISPYAAETRFYWIHFTDFEGTGINTADRFSGGSTTSLSVPKTAHVSEPDRVVELFQRFMSDQESGVLTDQLASHLLLLIFLEIVRQTDHRVTEEVHSRQIPNVASRNEVPDRCGEGLVARMRATIDTEYSEAITVEGLARKLGFSADYIQRVFRRETGERLTHAINRRRIEAACRCLREENALNVSEIGARCGYRSPAYFHRRFKEFVGMSPKQFRALYPRAHINTH